MGEAMRTRPGRGIFPVVRVGCFAGIPDEAAMTHHAFGERPYGSRPVQQFLKDHTGSVGGDL